MRLHLYPAFSPAALAVFGAIITSGALAAAPSQTYPLYGQWQSTDPASNFSARGMPYRTIDIAPCGSGDFCGVSVGATGACGATLFRFYIKHLQDGDSRIQGHAAWGNRNEEAQTWFDSDNFAIVLGHNADVTGRSGSIPIFNTQYHKTGEAKCTAN
jgi:hypothetical protein